jgi:hypothetical protein
MHKQEILFSDHRSLGVFPENRNQLSEALNELGLLGSYKVIVLIGGYIPDVNATVTQTAIEIIAAFAEENNITIICGGTTVGIMGSIGQTRLSYGYQFPLLGITLKNLVSWPDGLQSNRFLWWGRERWPLSSGYSHFMLVPGEQFGEDSPWIAEAASCLSQRDRSVTILANGGGVARKDIDFSLANNRPVIVLAGTGRLADELAAQPGEPSRRIAVQANDRNEIVDAIQTYLDGDTIGAGRR